MEYLMKGIISVVTFLVVFLQVEGDFAIHEGRKTWWHFWKGLSLFLLGLMPLTLWIFMDNMVMLIDYVMLLLVYLSYRWLFFDPLMNENLGESLDYIGTTAFYARLLHRIFPKQSPQGYLWIRLVAFVCWNLVWWFRFKPGTGMLSFEYW